MLRHRPTSWRGAGAAAVLLCALGFSAEAANLKAAPSLSLEVERNTNITNLPGNTSSDYIFRASPRLTLTVEAFRSAVNLSGGFDAERYAEHDELNGNSSTKTFDLTMVQPLQVTPRFSFRPTARFVDSVDPVRRNQITQNPTPDLPPSETLVAERTRTREYAGGLQAAYLLTPAAGVSVGAGGAKREFPGGPPTLIGSRTLSGNALVTRQLSPVVTPGIFFETRHNSFDPLPGQASSNSRTYTAGLAGTYLLTAHHSLEARAGGTYLSNNAGTGGPSTHEWAPYARLSASYGNRDFRAVLFGSYEIAGTGSLGRTTKRAATTLSLGDQFLKSWWWDLSGSCQSNRSTDDAVTEDIVTADANATVRYDLAAWASVRLAGSVFRQWSHGAVGDNLKRESLLLGFTVTGLYTTY